MAGFFSLPAMLWWSLAAIVPILIHLFARQRYRRLPWAAMDLLQRAYKRTRSRLRLEHLLLLLLRILILLLIVLALADPRLENASLLPEQDGPRNVIVVLDDSASMGLVMPSGLTPFDQAKEEALRLIEGLRFERGDVVTVITAGAPAGQRLEPVSELELVRAEVEELTVTAGATDLVRALRICTTLMRGGAMKDLPPADIYYFTDLQANAFSAAGIETDAPGSPSPPFEEGGGDEVVRDVLREIDELRGTLTVVAPTLSEGGENRAPEENVAITELDWQGRSPVVGIPTRITATVTNFGTRRASGTVQLRADGGKQQLARQVVSELEPGKSQIVEFTHRFETPGEHALQALFGEDELAADNQRSLCVTVREEIRVLIVDGSWDREPAEQEGFFLQRAIAPAPEEGALSSFRVEAGGVGLLRDLPEREVDLLCLLDVPSLPPEAAPKVEAFVQEGGGLWVAVGPRTRSETWNDLLWRDGEGVLPARLGAAVDATASGDTDDSLRIDVRVSDRPPFRYFSDPRTGPFLRQAPVRRFLDTLVDEEPTTRVLAVFNRASAPLPDPRPAFIEGSFGAGRVILQTSSIDQEWNDLPTFFVAYVPLVNEIAHHLVAQRARGDDLVAGSQYRRIFRGASDRVQLLLDGEAPRELSPVPTEDDQGFKVEIPAWMLRRAGLYRLAITPRGAAGPETTTAFFSVNTDPRESDLTRIPAAELAGVFEREGLSVARDVETANEAIEERSRADLWRWLLYAAGLVMLVETALSQWFAIRSERGRSRGALPR